MSYPNINKVTTRSNSTSSLNIPLTLEQNPKRPRDDAGMCAAGISSFDELWSRIESANKTIEAKIESCYAKINDVEGKLATLKEECTTNVKMLTAAVGEIRKDLHATHDWVGRMEKSSELIISSVPYVTGEDLKSIFGEITKALQYDSVPLVGLKRLARAPKPGETPAILCQFSLRLDRDLFYRKYLERHNLNLGHIGFQSTNRIYVNENLTQSDRTIRTEALKLKRQGLLLQVYTNGGVVFVKPPSAAAAVPCYTLEQLVQYHKKPSPE